MPRNKTLLPEITGSSCRYVLGCAIVSAIVLVVAGCSSSGSTSATPEGDAAPVAESGDGGAPQAAEDTAPGEAAAASSASAEGGIPRLLDLGAGKCIPCKMMAPILDELEKEYEGVFDVDFVDVWERPEEAQKYGIETIPTQIFFDASGKEVFRHVGFFSRDEILATWKQVGVELKDAKGAE